MPDTFPLTKFYRLLVRQGWLWPGLIFGATLAVYIRTLLPGATGGDAGELQYAGPLLALVHPTGQPLYLLLGFLWSHLIPIGTAAYRMNLLAAVSGAAACAFLAWVLNRLYGKPVIALAGGLTLGFGSTFWGQAVFADKYAFTALTASVVTGLALYWTKVQTDKWLYALSLAYGLSLLHHRSLFVFAPALILLVLFYERSALWRNYRRTLICLALVLLPPLIIYPLALPWLQARLLSPIEWQPTTASEWINWWLERQFVREALVFDSPAGMLKLLTDYLQTLLSDHTFIVPVIAGLGLIALARRAPFNLVFIALSYLLVSGLAANYRANERQFTYYLPSFVILIYAYGEGLAALWQMIAAGLQKWNKWLPAVGVASAILVLGVPAFQFQQAYPLHRAEAIYGAPLDIWRQTLKTGNQAERLAAKMSDLPQNAVVIGDWEQITVLWYYQHIENRRPDLKIVYPVERLSDYANDSREVCLTRHLPVGAEWHPTNIGALVHLQRQPNFTVSERAAPLGIALQTPEGTPQLELSGFEAAGNIYAAGQHTPLLLTWKALTDNPADYSISLHILNEAWEQAWAQDIAAPVLGMYPTSRWVKGEVVQDYHELDIPREMPPGQYLWTVVVYRQLPDGSFMQLRDAQGNIEILGGTFEVIAR